MAIGSSSQIQDGTSRGTSSQKRKLKKLRSVKLSKLPSLQSSTRRAKSRFEQLPSDLSGDDASPKRSSPNGITDVSPNYAKTAGTSVAKKSFEGESESEGISSGLSTTNGGSKAGRPSRRTWDSRIKEGTEVKKTLKRLKSTKLVTFGSFRSSRRRTKPGSDQPSVKLSRHAAKLQRPPAIDALDASPKYLRPHFQDLGVDRATCSSTIKDSKFPHHVELEQNAQSESDRISMMKVCHYSRCSLNSHHHATVQLPQHFSKKRPSLKSQRSMKRKNLIKLGVKRSGESKKEFQASKSQTVSNTESAIQEGASAITPISPTEKSDFFIDVSGVPKTKLSRRKEENEGIGLAEILFGETSYPDKNLQESLNQIRNLHKTDKSGSEVVNIDWKGGKTVESENGHGISYSTVMDEHCDFVDLGSVAPSLKPDDKASTYKEVSELDTESCQEPSSMAQKVIPNDSLEATGESRLISPVSICDPLEELGIVKEEKNGDSKPDGGSIRRLTLVGGSESKATSPKLYRTLFNKEKHVSMWHLIHQHMVPGLDAEASAQPLQGSDRDERINGGSALPPLSSYSSRPNFSDSDMESDGTVSEGIEPDKIYAIKMVREAIEKILLPEVPDQLSDDQSIAGEYGTDKTGDGLSMDIKEKKSATNHNCVPEGKKTAPKSWSNLKKLMLLKRFIKALERVRKFNIQRPDRLPLEPPHPGLGKVSLRHQLSDERRSSEEWMLDYALQQAVSKLAPIQKRKVALLVEAFETVAPHIEQKHILATFSEPTVTSPDYCYAMNEQDKSTCEATEIDTKEEETLVNSSASIFDTSRELDATGEEKNRDLGLKAELLGRSPAGDSESKAIACEANKTQSKKETHISLWQMIHQHVISGLAAEAETQIQKGVEKVKQVDDTDTELALKGSSSLQEFSESEQNMDMKHHDKVSPETEIQKIYAVKLVREAIEKILLPEVQDQSFDDQLINSDVISGQELSDKDGTRVYDKNEAEDVGLKELKETKLATGTVSVPEEDKTTNVDTKPDKQMPNGWSNLKKLILLKKFVKALEKVRNFNPRQPRYLPLKPDPEGEKVSLRCQVMEERKGAEEWMLDYALRKVVSELEPTQKRKVALLVKAFETVVPLSEERHTELPFHNSKDASHDGYCVGNEMEASVSEATDTGTKVMKNIESNMEYGNGISIITDKHSGTCDLRTSIVEGSQLHNELCLKPDDNVNVFVDKKDQQEVKGDVILDLNLELLKCGSQLRGKNSGNNGKSTSSSNVTSSASAYDAFGQLNAAREEHKGESDPECVVFEGTPLPGNFGSEHAAKVVIRSQLDKQKYIKMWHHVYQHVASGIAAKYGTQLLLDGDDEEEQTDGYKTMLESRTSEFCHGYTKSGNDMGKGNLNANYQRIEFGQSDAAKLVQEAIDEIFLPEIEDDSSDAQSSTGDVTPDQELLEKSHGKYEELSRIASTDSAKDSSRKHDKSEKRVGISLVQGEKGSAADKIVTAEERVASMVGKISTTQKPKNWSKLKKLVLLKRSIKALQNMRISNPQLSQDLPSDLDPKAEKVDLRHQMVDERKKAEQWMLDYALQNIVTKLTPARTRKVSLLVEAFEAVFPLPEI